MPTMTRMMRELRGTDMSSLAPSNEALIFAMYYAAITSMEEDDVSTLDLMPDYLLLRIS
jgi:hypothetical protein